MNIELYEFGLDNSLEEAEKLLRCALCDRTPKKDRQKKVAEALGIVETVRQMVWVRDSDEQTEGDTE